VIESADGSIARVNQYEFERALGRGTSGAHVYLARAGSMNYAIKMYSKSMLKKRRLGQSGDKFAAVMNEINVMRRLQHPNIIRLHEVIDDPERDELFIGVLSDCSQNSNFFHFDVDVLFTHFPCRQVFYRVHVFWQ
jgi:[calcium/calmodulin-dependent protein kinase] kinase